MITHTPPRSWLANLLIIAVFIAALLLALTTALPVHAAQVVHSAPSGWQLLVNTGQEKCLNLVSGNALQRCNYREENQHYAVLSLDNDTVLLVNRATAMCVSVTDRNMVGLVACNTRPRRGVTLEWDFQGLGASRFHLLSDGRALTTRHTGLVLSRPDDADLNQAWQFR